MPWRGDVTRGGQGVAYVVVCMYLEAGGVVPVGNLRLRMETSPLCRKLESAEKKRPAPPTRWWVESEDTQLSCSVLRWPLPGYVPLCTHSATPTGNTRGT